MQEAYQQITQISSVEKKSANSSLTVKDIL